MHDAITAPPCSCSDDTVFRTEARNPQPTMTRLFRSVESTYGWRFAGMILTTTSLVLSKGPDHGPDAHCFVPDGDPQHLQTCFITPKEELRRAVRAVADDLEASPVAAVAGAKWVGNIHFATLSLAAIHGDICRQWRGSSCRELY